VQRRVAVEAALTCEILVHGVGAERALFRWVLVLI
jgi:hypothetical protein